MGLIDGAVESNHPDFADSVITSLDSTQSVCRSKDSPACVHGTFVAGVLCAKRASRPSGICPGATLITHSLFCEARDLAQCPVVTPQHLADAIIEVTDAGAKVINLSLGLSQSNLGANAALHRAFDHAFHSGVLLVGASGNQGRIGHNPLFDHPWVIPVAACDLQGRLTGSSNIGKSVGMRGLLAPGQDVISTYSKGGYVKLSGTSIATPFVTGSIAFLWSLFPEATPSQIKNAITGGSAIRRSIIPPVLNVAQSKSLLAASLSHRPLLTSY